MKAARLKALCLGTALVVASPSPGSAQSWTTWTSSNGSSVSGTLNGFGVLYSGIYYAAQLSGSGFDYFNYAPGAYTQNGLTAPTNSGFIQIVHSAAATIFFATPVVNPYIAFISVGQPNYPVSYTFSAPFTVRSNNNTQCPYWGCGSYTTSGNSFTGNEFSGTVQFQGTYSSISFTANPDENWHGLTVGADAVVATPEPASLTLLGTGFAALGGFVRRRRQQRTAAAT